MKLKFQERHVMNETDDDHKTHDQDKIGKMEDDEHHIDGTVGFQAREFPRSLLSLRKLNTLV